MNLIKCFIHNCEHHNDRNECNYDIVYVDSGQTTDSAPVCCNYEEKKDDMAND